MNLNDMFNMKSVWLHMGRGRGRDINFPMVYQCVNNYFAEKNIFLQLEWLFVNAWYQKLRVVENGYAGYVWFILFGSFGFAKKLNFFVLVSFLLVFSCLFSTVLITSKMRKPDSNSDSEFVKLNLTLTAIMKVRSIDY